MQEQPGKRLGKFHGTIFIVGRYLESEKCRTVGMGLILMAIKGLKRENIVWLGCTSRTQAGWDPVLSDTKMLGNERGSPLPAVNAWARARSCHCSRWLPVLVVAPG